MNFREILMSLVNDVPGAHAAMIMAKDGIPLDEYRNPSLNGAIDLQSVGVEYSSLINEFRKNAQNLGVEGMDEVSVRGDQWTFLVRVVNDEYFLILALQSSGYFGKGRYLLRKASHQVRNQL